MQAIGRQTQRAPDGAPVHCERHSPGQTTLCRLVQRHAATFFAQAENVPGADLPQFIKDEFGAFLECGKLAHGFLRLRCGDCGREKLVAFRCKRRGSCPSCGARRVAQTVLHLVDHVMPHAPVRQWVLSLPTPNCQAAPVPAPAPAPQRPCGQNRPTCPLHPSRRPCHPSPRAIAG